MNAPDSRVERIRAGDRRAVARAITLVENEHRDAHAILTALAPYLGRAHLVGVTGPPGAGKSTLVNALVKELLARDQQVAVVAVDPSSPITGGAVLGDRIRMGETQTDARVFIRSLAARGHLGGLSRTTAQVVNVLDAAGFSTVIIETVGAGQSEVEIAKVADTRLVVCPPGLGDDIQALKAGVLEIADALVVNKADLPGAERTEKELRSMLALRARQPKPPVLKTVAISGEGVSALVDWIEQRKSSVKRRAKPEDGGVRSSIPPNFAHDSYTRYLNIEFVEAGAGSPMVRMRVDPEHLNRGNNCRGGAIFSLAEVAFSRLGTKPVAHIESRVTFPMMVKPGEWLVARVVEEKRTRKRVTYRADIVREEGAVLASFIGTVDLNA